MDVNEALQFADSAIEGATFYEGMRGPLMAMAVLAAEVRRLQATAVEAVPFGYASTGLDGVPNKDGHDLIVKDAPFYCSDKQDCIPLYTHPPALDDDTRTPVAEIIEQVRALKLPCGCDDCEPRNEGIDAAIEILERYR